MTRPKSSAQRKAFSPNMANLGPGWINSHEGAAESSKVKLSKSKLGADSDVGVRTVQLLVLPVGAVLRLLFLPMCRCGRNR